MITGRRVLFLSAMQRYACSRLDGDGDSADKNKQWQIPGADVLKKMCNCVVKLKSWRPPLSDWGQRSSESSKELAVWQKSFFQHMELFNHTTTAMHPFQNKSEPDRSIEDNFCS